MRGTRQEVLALKARRVTLEAIYLVSAKTVLTKTI